MKNFIEDIKDNFGTLLSIGFLSLAVFAYSLVIPIIVIKKETYEVS